MIELLVSIFVISIALLAMLLANSYIQKRSEQSYEELVATQDAHRAIELMRNTASTGTFPGNVIAAYPDGGAVAGYNNLRSEQVTVSYASTTSDPLDVTVTTNWSGQGVRNRTAQLRTLMTQR